jgi:hypothetical protein
MEVKDKHHNYSCWLLDTCCMQNCVLRPDKRHSLQSSVVTVKVTAPVCSLARRCTTGFPHPNQDPKEGLFFPRKSLGTNSSMKGLQGEQLPPSTWFGTGQPGPRAINKGVAQAPGIIGGPGAIDSCL